LNDIGIVRGRDNLGQAVILRLLTPRGELAELGHPEYGSRLHELIGNLHTATTRNVARLFILESLQQEPRIAKVTAVEVTAAPGLRDAVRVLLQIRPVAATEIVTIGPFTLELAP
jgi:phage baseplate assembly protein W